jgi:hypothetical protein
MSITERGECVEDAIQRLAKGWGRRHAGRQRSLRAGGGTAPFGRAASRRRIGGVFREPARR